MMIMMTMMTTVMVIKASSNMAVPFFSCGWEAIYCLLVKQWVLRGKRMEENLYHVVVHATFV